MNDGEKQRGSRFEFGSDFLNAFPDFRPHLDCLIDGLAFMKEALDQPQELKVPDDQESCLRLAIMLLAAKGVKTAHAIALLLTKGLIEDAAVLLRSMMEVVINMKYIAASKDRARAYLDYEAVARHKMTQVMKKQGYDVSSVEAERAAAYESVKDKFPDDYKDWSQSSIRKMAKSVGFGEHYELVYGLLCDFAHAGPMSTSDYADVSDDGDTHTLSESGAAIGWFEAVTAQAAAFLVEIAEELRTTFGEPPADVIEPYHRRVAEIFGL